MTPAYIKYLNMKYFTFMKITSKMYCKYHIFIFIKISNSVRQYLSVYLYY